MRPLLMLYIWIFLCAEHGHATERFRVDNLSTKNGLFENTLHKVFRDRDGNLWILGVGGVARYNGTDIVNFTEQEDTLNHYIKGQRFRLIEQDMQGDIWVGSYQGLQLYDAKALTFRRIHDSRLKGITFLGTGNDSCLFITGANRKNFLFNVFTREITGINVEQAFVASAKDGTGTNWFATSGGAFYRGGDEPVFSLDLSINDICFSPAGNLFVGTDNGLYCIEATDLNRKNGAFRRIQKEDEPLGLTSNYVTSVEYADGSIWAGTTNGLNELVLDRHELPEIALQHLNKPGDPFSLICNQVNDILRDDEGIIWMATHGGLSKWEPGKLWFFSLQKEPGIANSLHDNRIFPMTGDRKGNIWFGSYTSGVSRYSVHEEQFSWLHRGNSRLENDFIRFLYTDLSDDTWLSTNKKLFRAEATDLIPARILDASANPLQFSNLSAVVQHPDGSYWMGIDQRILKLRKVNDTTFKIEKELVKQVGLVIRFFVDRYKRIWAGTSKGAYCIDNDHSHSFIRYYKGNQSLFRSNVIQAVTEDSEGNIWLASTSGIYVTENDSIIDFEAQNKEFNAYFAEDGLPHNYVTGLLPGEDGVMWISSWKGIVKYDPECIGPFRFTHYDYTDGMVSEKFNRNGFFYDSLSRTFYFGGINGINYFTPGKKVRQKPLPDLVFGEVLIDGAELEFDERVKDSLIARKKHLGTIKNLLVRYGSSSLLSPDRQIFATKIEGRDKDWTFSRKNELRINDLKPGKYALKVCSATQYGEMGPLKLIEIQVESMFVRLLKILLPILLIGIILYFYFSRSTLTRQTEKYAFSTLDEEKSNALKKKLERVMEKERPYRNPDITAGELAALVEIDTVTLSQLLNDSLQTKFYKYMNKYRVNEFVRKIENGEGENLTLMGLAETCGFKSKSTFYRAFGHEKGMTPAQFSKVVKGIEV
ncbi:MAG: helix-turn-helix domain-containing protein [Cytophagales bacterium]|nr:helix-turn-helix domain-containing protein [Cytophagales bacterium]